MTRRLLLVAGRPSHRQGEHEFRAGAMLLRRCLSDVRGLSVVVHPDGWLSSAADLGGADAVVIYADGGSGHPLLEGDHLGVVTKFVEQGGGLGLMHFALELPAGRGAREADTWTGGHYEDLVSCNPIFEARFDVFPDHPITRGVRPFTCRDEWYFNIQLNGGAAPVVPGDYGGTWVTPLLVATPSDDVRAGPYVWPHGPYGHIVAASGRPESLMWAVERSDGGRGFGLTGGHFHANWLNEQLRRVTLNALVWLAGAEVPANGVASSVTDDDLADNLDGPPTTPVS